MKPTTQKLTVSQLSLYNPARLSDDEIVASFAARQAVFDRIIADIVVEKPDSRSQHHLIVGQRGMGKSTLLARIAAELRQNPELSSVFVPLAFAEEQYSVDRLSKFWLNCLDSLADACEKADNKAATDRIDYAVRQLTSRLGTSAAEDAGPAAEALEAFLTETKHLKRRPVLLVDNLQLVFDRISEQQQHVLRELLQRPGAPLLLGASPSPPPASQDYGAAFYDHFKVHYLPSLSVEEMRQLMLTLAEKVNRPDISNNLLKQPHRLDVLRQLTGGNPRTTVTLFFLYAEDFSPNVFGDLENLLDRMTPLYKARFEELSTQQQVIASAVANHWDPLTARTLSDATGLPISGISPQLDRLEKIGFIERVKLFEESSTGYQIAERFFNVWFLMRSASRRQRREVEFLTRFIECFYEEQERTNLSRQLQSEFDFSPDRHVFAQALACTLNKNEARDLRRHTEIDALQQKQTDARRKLAEVIDFSKLPPASIAFVDLKEKLCALVPLKTTIKPTDFAATVLGSRQMFQTGNRNRLASQKQLKAIEISKIFASIEASNAVDEKDYGKEAVTWLAYRLSSGKLAVLDDLEEWNTAINSAHTASKLQILLDTLPKEIGCRLSEEAISNIRQYLRPTMQATATAWFCWGYDLHITLGKFEEAEAAYRQAIGLDAKYSYAWNNLGNLLMDHFHHYEEAETAFRQSIAHDKNGVNPLNGLGNLLMKHFGRFAEAEAAYRQAIKLNSKLAYLWNNLGNLLMNHLRRYEEAEAAYKEATTLDPSFSFAWNGLGNLLKDHLGRYQEAESAYRKAILCDDKYPSPWNGLGNLLSENLGRYEEAEIAYRKALTLEPKLAYSWNNLANLLMRRFKRFEEAETAFRQAISLNQGFAYPWNGLGTLLTELNRFQEAELAYRQAITVDEKYAPPWNGLGNLFKDLKRYDEAEGAYRKAISLDDKFAHPLNGLGNLLKDHLNRFAEAEDAYRQAIALDTEYEFAWSNLAQLLHYNIGRYQDAEDAYLRAIRLNDKSSDRWNNYGNLLLEHLLRFEEAEAAYRRAITLDEKSPYPWNNLGNLLKDHLNRFAEAEAAYRQAIALDESYSQPWNGLGNLYCDHLNRYSDAANAFKKAQALDPDSLFPSQNLIFLHRDFLGEGLNAEARFQELLNNTSIKSNADEIVELHRTLFAGYAENWGAARESLTRALEQTKEGFSAVTFDDWFRASAVLLHLNFGEQLLSFLKERGDDTLLRPWYEALCALHKGDKRHLQNLAPEIRTVAERYFDQIEHRLNTLPEKTRRRPLPTLAKNTVRRSRA